MLKLSPLSKTWILDVDGTLLKHNGYLHGEDVLLDGVREFFANIDPSDKVILLTARKQEYLEDLKSFLDKNNLRYDNLICDVPMGERILVNDEKPSGLKTAYAINKVRDEELKIHYDIDKNL